MDVRFTYDINGILEVDVTVVSTKEHFSKVIVNKDIHLTPEQIEERRKELQKIKIHPREQEKNRLLLERGDRLYEEKQAETKKEDTKKTPEKSENIWTRSWQIFQLH